MSSASLSQLLRAAQILDPNSIINKSASTLNELNQILMNDVLLSFGDNYKELALASKMRPTLLDNCRPSVFYPSNSTGSSRRSSPLSVPASSPNSPSSSAFSITSPIMKHSSASANTPPMMMTSVAIPEFQNPAQFDPSAASNRNGANNKLSPNSRQSRAAHNELEKNRRAHLRGYLDTLKDVMPNDPECSRDTTLSLLTRARNHIQVIKEQKAVLLKKRNALLAEHMHLSELLQKTNELLPSSVNVSELPSQISETQERIQSTPSPTIVVDDGPSFSGTVSKNVVQQLFAGGDLTESSNQNTRFVDKHTLYMLGLLQALPLAYPYTNNPLKTSC